MEQECPESRNSNTEPFIPKSKNHVVIQTNPTKEALRKSLENGESITLIKRQPKWVHVWPQVLASCIALSTTIQAGINMAYSSILLPQLIEDNQLYNFTKAEASWVASVVAIGTPVGALIAGPLMDLIGRKRTCIISNIPVLTSWILMYTTRSNVWSLYVARAFAGFGAGMTTVALVYTAEISHSLYRPMLLCLNSVFVAYGVMMTNVLGAYMRWRSMALLFGLLSIFSFSLCLVLPESPNWLVTFTPSDKRATRALEELQKLNRPTWLFQEECRKLKEILNERKNALRNQDKSNIMVRLWRNRKEMCDMSFIAPLLILVTLFFLQQLSGVYVIIFYSVQIFEKIILIDKYTGTVILGILRFVMSMIAACLSRIYGRKPLMIVSSLGMTMSCGLAAAILSISGEDQFRVLSNHNTSVSNMDSIINNFNNNSSVSNTVSMINNNSSVSNMDSIINNLNLTNATDINDIEIPVYDAVTLITVGLILIFMCFGAIGHLVIPWTLISELLPNKARAIGSGFLICFAYILMFLTVQTFLPLLDSLGVANILYFYALISFLTAPFTYFCIPETLGKTFQEISKSFKRTNR